MAEPVVIRGYREVFRFERRLFRLDRWQLPVRGGVPLRALAYVPVALLVVIVAGAVPVLGAVVGALPAPVRWVLIPGALTWALLELEVDGRQAWRAGWARLRWRLGPRWTNARGRSQAPGTVSAMAGVLTVGPGPAAGSGRLRGPARLVLCGRVELVRSGSRYWLRRDAREYERAGLLELRAREELCVQR